MFRIVVLDLVSWFFIHLIEFLNLFLTVVKFVITLSFSTVYTLFSFFQNRSLSHFILVTMMILNIPWFITVWYIAHWLYSFWQSFTLLLFHWYLMTCSYTFSIWYFISDSLSLILLGPSVTSHMNIPFWLIELVVDYYN